MDKGGLAYLGVVGCAAIGIAAALGLGGSPRSRATPPPGGTDAPAPSSFVNWETGQVHPVDMTPDASRFLVCNTADDRLEVFDVSMGVPVLVSEIPVGLDPIAVRARTNTEVWVVNNISDSVSVVSLATRNVVATLKTHDEPSDVVFAGTPQRAFVSCSQVNKVQVFDPTNLGTAPVDIAIKGKDPRAMAVSPDGQTVYVAVFNSGNATTLLGGGSTMALPGVSFPPNVVSYPDGPYAGLNPPPNSGADFDPPQAGANPPPPRVGLIVRKDASGHWMDDNAHDWTEKISGSQSADSGRVAGWDMPDRDLAAIDTSSLSISYATGLMNICAGLGVNPATGIIAVVGTDAINQIRFEPNVRGRFVRVMLALVDPALTKTIKDLNPHLVPYTQQQVVQSERDKSIGDPRGVVWNNAGSKAYITGLGSNNLIVVNASGDRAGLAQTIPVGEGPTGLAMDEARGRLYVLNRFAATLSVVDVATETVVATVPFFDPTPSTIKIGRKELYDTHKTSGLGQAACASCHVDARMDHLAWDLGDPSGTVKQLTGQNLGAGIPGLAPPAVNPNFQPWHPMKGPMVTQTLQDIIGREPFHWRGDRAGLEEFNGAFESLLGDDTQLTAQEMQEFEDFLATITFPPNPFRNFDNTMPTMLETGQTTPERFGTPGLPLPQGRPNVGVSRFRDITTAGRIDMGAFACVSCHNLPTGTGPNATFSAGSFHAIAAGPNGEQHHQLVSLDGSANVTFKTPQLRNAYMKLGFDCNQSESMAGFGFSHDGGVDTIARFCSEPLFDVTGNQDIADLTAFLMCFSGSDLPAGSNTSALVGPGTPSKDVPASVGQQTTVVDGSNVPAAQSALISQMITLAQANKVGLVVKGVVSGEQRGFAYRTTGANFQSDRAGEVYTPAQLLALAHAGAELTYTVVPKNTETRIGIDRDENGVFDRDQADTSCYANCDGSHTPPILNINDFVCFQALFAAGDPRANCDGSTEPPVLNISDFICFQSRFAAGCP
jgi:YVTN family beta-propeller protein